MPFASQYATLGKLPKNAVACHSVDFGFGDPDTNPGVTAAGVRNDCTVCHLLRRCGLGVGAEPATALMVKVSDCNSATAMC